MNDGMVVMVAGATGGIGREVVWRLLQGGAKAATFGRSEERLTAMVNEFYPDFNAFHGAAVDVTNAAAVQAFTEDVTAKFGRLDAVVNAAGAGHLGPFDQTDETTLRRLLDVNVVGPWNTVQAALPAFTAQKSGHIVNLPGILGIRALANATAYCASKWALMGMMGALAQEVKRAGIRITNICSTGVNTPFWDGIPGKPREEFLLSAGDVAAAIVNALNMPVNIAPTEIILQNVAHQMA